MPRKLPVRVIAHDYWPAVDRHAWSRARTKGNVLDEQGGLSNIEDIQIPQLRRVYGSWLGYLAEYEGLPLMCSAPGSLDTSLSHAAGLIEIAACHA